MVNFAVVFLFLASHRFAAAWQSQARNNLDLLAFPNEYTSKYAYADLNIGHCMIDNLEPSLTADVEVLDVADVKPFLPPDLFTWFDGLGSRAHSRSKPVVRKEYRTMRKEERLRFHSAIWELRRATYDDHFAMFDVFTKLHSPVYSAPSIRASPIQYGWHREYLLRFEQALIDIEPEIYLPYWDVSLDAYLPDKTDSLMWDTQFMGPCGGAEADATVQEGPFAFFPVSWEIRFVTEQTFGLKADTLTRTCMSDNYTIPFSDIELVAALDGVETLSHFLNRNCFVKDHDMLHGFIGGTTRGAVQGVMLDPASWLMHSWLDTYWEVFRQGKQRTLPSEDYPSHSEPLFSPTATFNPFYSMKNIEGLSNEYTDRLYVVEEVPVSCLEHSDCAYDSLFCMKEIGRCQSKLREGANCEILGADACYSNFCSPKGTCEIDWLAGYRN